MRQRWPKRLKDIDIGDIQHLTTRDWLQVIWKLIIIVFLRIGKTIAYAFNRFTASLGAKCRKYVDSDVNLTRSIFVRRWRKDEEHMPEYVHLWPKCQWEGVPPIIYPDYEHLSTRKRCKAKLIWFHGKDSNGSHLFKMLENLEWYIIIYN